MCLVDAPVQIDLLVAAKSLEGLVGALGHWLFEWVCCAFASAGRGGPRGVEKIWRFGAKDPKTSNLSLRYKLYRFYFFKRKRC